MQRRGPVALLDAASRLTGELLALVSPSGAVLWASDGLTALVGRPLPPGPCEALPLVHPDDRGVASAAWIEAVRGNSSGVRAELRVAVPDGWCRLDVTVRDHLADPDVRAFVLSARPVPDRPAPSPPRPLRVASEPHAHNSDGTGEHERNLLRDLVAASRDVACVVGLDGTVRYVTPNVTRVLGWSACELVGRSAFDLVHLDDVDEAATRLAAATAGVDSTPLHLRLLDRSGTVRMVEASGAPLTDADGRVDGVVINLRDLDGRLVTESAVRASEARLRAVVQHRSEVTAIVDGTGTITWVTPNCIHLLDRGSDELLGTNGFELVHPADRADLAEELRRFLAGATTTEPKVVRLRERAGRWRHVEISATNLLNNADIAGIVLSLRDIDDRVAAEQARARLIDILELSHDLVGIADAEGHLLYANEAAARFFGFDPDRHRPNLFRGLPDDLAHWGEEQLVPELCNGGIWRGEITLRRQDGTLVPHLAQFIVHKDANGQPAFFSGVLRDIGVRKALEERLAHQATHDPLTGLPNRTLLLDRLEQALARSRRSQRTVALLFCDLDDFKTVNDEFGHRAGDELLEAIAERLQHAVRPTDTVARFGGDEFVILCEDLDDVTMARTIAARVEAGLAEPFDYEGRSMRVGGSIGIALSNHHGDEPEELLRAADAAMYRAKGRRRGRVEIAPLRPAPASVPVRRDEARGEPGAKDSPS